MKRREAMLAVGAAALVALALLTVFAIELSDTQAKSKRDVTARVHERAVLAAALIDSLFQAAGQQIPQDSGKYGARVVSAGTMNAARMQSTYLALLDSGGRVLASSVGFTAQARAGLAASTALRLIASGHPYGLGDVLPYGRTGVVDLAIAFPTAFGPRILLTGFRPSALGTFIDGELRKIPGVAGAHSYLIDGHRAVIGSTDPAIPVGHVFDTPAQIQALARPSGDVRGHYYDQVRLSNSTWRVVLAAPDGPLFASVAGLRKWVPWIIFVAFALVALACLLLGRRVLGAAEDLGRANARLELANEALESTNGQLERRAVELARSNAELEQFASIASHDLQEPLRKVRTFTERLVATESARLSEQGHDYLRRANDAAERMQRLIEDLLKLSRVATHGRPYASVDLQQVTREVLEDLEHEVERAHAEVSLHRLPTIIGDALQMRQLMQNLVSNALKFRRAGVAPQVVIEGVLSHDGTATITVTDNGIGFEPQYGRRIFRVFERLHSRGEYPGTGIGLALCRKIAERHGGTVVGDGEPGVGATFTVTLPVDQRQEVIAPKWTPDHEDAYVSA